MSIKIDKGIPIPARSRYDDIYPLKDMEKGDSFFIATTDDDDRKKTREKLSIVVHNYKRNKDINFTVKMVSGGVRVWRTQ